MANVYNIYPRKESVLNAIALREQGILTNSLFQHDVMKVKLNQLTELPEHHSFEDHSVFPCHYFRARADGSIVGVQHCYACESFCAFLPRKYASYISVLQFSFNSLCRVNSNNPLPFTSNLEVKSCLYETMQIVDTADVYHHFQTPLLFIGNHYRGRSVAILTYCNCENRPRDIEWRLGGPLYCCASNAHSDQFAVGGVGGYYLCKRFIMDKKQKMTSNVLSLEFNDDGNLLFISREKGIEICDVRENTERNLKRIRRDCLASTCEDAISGSLLIANKMQLLSDQVSLIVSNLTGKMSKIDLRMRKPVFWYPEHGGIDDTKTISLSEDLDLLSALGRDGYARVWSLSSGRLYWKEKVCTSNSSIEKTTHCCLITRQRKWFITVAAGKKVIPIVPDFDSTAW